jgi:peptidoglycan/xylan/chitin deacetylase (PgdA/CDA1 family)
LFTSLRAVIRRLRGLLANGGTRSVGLIVGACAIAIPAYAYWHSTRPRADPPLVHVAIHGKLRALHAHIAGAMNVRYYGPAAQVSLRLPRNPQLLRTMPDYANAVVVLCYHDLSPKPHNRYTVTPAAFAAQMSALRASGFHTISASTFAAFARGARISLPPRPLFITFDDGAKGTWIYADQILRRLSFRATVFLVTGDVSHHQPYYLDWPEVEIMSRSGRWSFGSHTHLGHGLVATDRAGHVGPFLINRMWLPEAKRTENLAEFRTRVTRDIRRSIADIEAHGLSVPRLFAYPFSATLNPTDDPATLPLLRRVLTQRFSALMDNSGRATLVRPRMRGPLPRVEVFHGEQAGRLLARVRNSIARRTHRTGKGSCRYLRRHWLCR